MRNLLKMAGILTIFVIVWFLFNGCATFSGTQSDPLLKEPSLLQTALNKLPEIPIAGRNLKFQFGGDVWIATLGGRNFLAGSVNTYETSSGIYMVLAQTHIYPPAGAPAIPGVPIGWIRTPGPELILGYTMGPPSSMRLIPASQQPPELAEARESAAVMLSSISAPAVPPGTDPFYYDSAPGIQAASNLAQPGQPLPRLIIVPLENRSGAANANDVETLTMLIGDFINDTKRLSVIDRSTFNTAMSVNRWQMNDWADDSKAAEMGKTLNADYIARGTVSRLGASMVISMRISATDTAETVSNANSQIPNIDDAFSRLGELTQNLIRTVPLQPRLQPVQAPMQQVTEQQLLLEALPVQESPVISEQETIQELLQMPLETAEIPGPGAQAEPMPSEETKPMREISPEEKRFHSIGASIGSALTANPVLIATIHGTFAPWQHIYVEPGCDFGFFSNHSDVESYYSIYPFVNLGIFLPFGENAGSAFFMSAGCGYMIAKYTFLYGSAYLNSFGFNAATGFKFWSFIMSYTLRTNFSSVNSKFALGYVYRFGL